MERWVNSRQHSTVGAKSALTGIPCSIQLRLKGVGLSELEIERILNESTKQQAVKRPSAD